MTDATVHGTGSDSPRAEQGEPKRGWRKLLLALIAFVLIPASPLRSLLPVDETMMLFVPAMAACALVGWWAGGRALSAVVWVTLTVVVTRQDLGATSAFASLLRGWTLLLAGAFGIACIMGAKRPLFSKALAAVGATFVLAMVMSAFGPVTVSGAGAAIDAEFSRRNAEAITAINQAIANAGPQWQAWTERFPALAEMPATAESQLTSMSKVGRAMFPALLALESLAALALAWATYHRLSRQRIGAPLAPLREFRFNDQFVWGLIVGLVIILLPNLAGMRDVGGNLILFFSALYAMRGLGVLAWFMAPGTFAMTLIAGTVLMFVPVLSVVAVLGFMTLGVTALGLGVGDTWVDWRSRARSTLS